MFIGPNVTVFDMLRGFPFITSHISGRGHRIRAVCVSVSTLTAEPFCMCLLIHNKEGLLGNRITIWEPWEVRERSDVFILYDSTLANTMLQVPANHSWQNIHSTPKESIHF